MARVAVTGTASYLGGRILRRLVDARGADEIVTVDIASPPAALNGVRHRMVDLTLPGADARLVDVFEEEGKEQADAFMGTWLEALIRTGALRDIDAAFIARSGERLPILFPRTAVLDADGAIADIICIAKNMQGYRKVSGTDDASRAAG